MKIIKIYKTILLISMASFTPTKNSQIWPPKNSTNNISNWINANNNHKRNKIKWLLITISMIIMTWITNTILLTISKLTNLITRIRITILILHPRSANSPLINIRFLICSIRIRIWYLKIIFLAIIEWTKCLQRKTKKYHLNYFRNRSNRIKSRKRLVIIALIKIKITSFSNLFYKKNNKKFIFSNKAFTYKNKNQVSLK